MTAPLTDDELAALESLLAAATPGPWAYRSPTSGFVSPVAPVTFATTVGDDPTPLLFIGSDDLALVEANSTALPRLLAEVRQLRARQQELLATIVRIANETPFPDEIKGWTDQRAKLVAEVGTLRARVAELEAK